MALQNTSSKTNQNKIDNKSSKLTAYQKEQIEVLKKINEFKLAAEASAVSIIYKCPEKLLNVNLSLEDITNNDWRVYFAIAHGMIVVEKNTSLTEIDINFYLEKHLKLKKKYEEYGGYETILSATSYVHEEALEAYVNEIKKWNAIIQLSKFGLPLSKERLKEFVDMTLEDIYKEQEGYLNHIFANAESEIKSYNALSGLHELVDKLNEGEQNGLPITAELLNKEIGGLRLGNIYGFIGGSGSGKSTTVMNYILPKIIEMNERIVIFINEEDETKVKRELLVYCCQNILKKPIQKVQLRDGNFDKETLGILHEAADWLEEQDKNHNITIIPLERYTADIVIKLIRKYKSLYNINYFIIDTLKESSNSKEDMWLGLLHDSVKLYDLVKPASLNVCLVVTLQTAKSALRNRHLTIADIGQSKSIVDIMSAAILMRKVEPEECKGEKKELKCYKIEGKSKIPFYLSQDKYYLLFFLGKNRFGTTDRYAIVTQVDFSTNYYKDIGYCVVPDDN